MTSSLWLLTNLRSSSEMFRQVRPEIHPFVCRAVVIIVPQLEPEADCLG